MKVRKQPPSMAADMAAMTDQAGQTMGMPPMVMPHQHSAMSMSPGSDPNLKHLAGRAVLNAGHNTIGPVKKGALHKALGMAQDTPISSTKLQTAKAKGGLMAKRAQFAINARKWGH